MKIFVLLVSLSSILISEQIEFNKCLFTSPTFKKQYVRLLQGISRPILEKNIISKNGKFRIHFDTSKISGNLPSLVDTSGERIINTQNNFIDSLNEILTFVAEKELTLFGFNFPPADGNLGGGSELDVYVIDLGNRTFGYTEWDEQTPIDNSKINKRYSTYIVIDNDYGKGFRTKGLIALKATIAHEFFHTIQIGNYGLWNEFLHYYEMSAEAMETTIYSSSVDYLFDLKDYFQNHNLISLMGSDNRFYGYERALWNIYLQAKFGFNITKLIWSEIYNQSPTYAQEKILKSNYSTSTAKEFISFTTENYRVNKTSQSNYYTNISLFPTLSIDEKINLSATEIISFGSKNFTSKYIQIRSGTDTSFVIIVCLKENEMLLNYSNLFQAAIKVFPSTIGTFKLSDNSSYDISFDKRNDWFHSSSTNNIFISSSSSSFPNPVNPDRNSLMIPTVNLNSANINAKLIILSSDFNPIYSGEEEIINYLGNTYVVWKCIDQNGKKVGSGVYYYFILEDEKKNIGKFVVLK